MRTIVKVILFIVLTNSLAAQTAHDYLNMASQALDAQDYYQAIESYRSALRLNAKYADALLGLARAYFFIGEYEETLEQLKLYQLYAKSIEAQILKGRSLAALTRKDEAQQVLAGVLAIQPNNLDAQFGMAEVQLLNGHYEGAIEEFEQLLMRVPDNRRALLSLLILYDEVGRVQDAENVLNKVLYYNPQNPLVLYMAGEHYYKQGSWSQALQYYNTVVLLQKNFPYVDFRRADVLLRLGRCEESASILEIMLKTGKRRNVDAWALLAAVFAVQGDIENASFSYNEALELDPNNEMIRLSVENYLRKNLPENSPMRQQYAMARFERGKKLQDAFLYDQAQREYRMGLLLSPDDITIRYAYARLQRLKGFHFDYVHQLGIIKASGSATPAMLSELEMEDFRPVASVAKNWNVPYGQRGEPIKIAIATLAGSNKIPFGTAEHLQTAFVTYLSRYTRLEVIDMGEMTSVSDAWREARRQNSQFFTLLNYKNGERDFYAGYELYLTSTSALVAKNGLARVSTTRIDNIFDTLSAQINQIIPMKATVLQRQEYQALVSLGSMHGVKVGDEFIIVRSQKPRFDRKAPYYAYNNRDNLGTIKITAVDEFVCEGRIYPKQQPDTVAREDELFLIQEVEAAETETPLLRGIPEGFLLIH